MILSFLLTCDIWFPDWPSLRWSDWGAPPLRPASLTSATGPSASLVSSKHSVSSILRWRSRPSKCSPQSSSTVVWKSQVSQCWSFSGTSENVCISLRVFYHNFSFCGCQKCIISIPLLFTLIYIFECFFENSFFPFTFHFKGMVSLWLYPILFKYFWLFKEFVFLFINVLQQNHFILVAYLTQVIRSCHGSALY